MEDHKCMHEKRLTKLEIKVAEIDTNDRAQSKVLDDLKGTIDKLNDTLTEILLSNAVGKAETKYNGKMIAGIIAGLLFALQMVLNALPLIVGGAK